MQFSLPDCHTFKQQVLTVQYWKFKNIHFAIIEYPENINVSEADIRNIVAFCFKHLKTIH